MLLGLSAPNKDNSVVEILVMEDSELSSSLQLSASLPSAIQDILHQFAEVFAVPSGLPPSRACNHAITLIEGARPVQVRPYRFSPALKDKIVKQVAEMLKNGIIEPSRSPFSSPVLLVPKKDKTWRFCVDYRYLNSLTQKWMFCVHMFEELLDELAGAKQFSSLDLTAGFHKVLMKAGDEFKTAFQTHFGHFEFMVMAFRLTTIQTAMNATLAPLLR